MTCTKCDNYCASCQESPCRNVNNHKQICEECSTSMTGEEYSTSIWYCEKCLKKLTKNKEQFQFSSAEYLYGSDGKRIISKARHKELWKKNAGHVPKQFQ